MAAVAVLVILAAIGINMLFAFPVMWLWNAVVPAIIPAAPAIGFWQAFGLMVLCSILFKSASVSSK